MKKFLFILLLIVVFVGGMVVGYIKYKDVDSLVTSTPWLQKILKPGETTSASDRTVRSSGTSSSSNKTTTSTTKSNSSSTASQSSSGSTGLPSLTGLFSGEIISVSANGKTYKVHKDFKSAMDAYEKYFDDYIATLKSLQSSNPISYFTKYSDMILQLEELEKYDDSLDNLTKDEENYYTYIMLKVNQKMISSLGSM